MLRGKEVWTKSKSDNLSDNCWHCFLKVTNVNRMPTFIIWEPWMPVLVFSSQLSAWLLVKKQTCLAFWSSKTMFLWCFCVLNISAKWCVKRDFWYSGLLKKLSWCTWSEIRHMRNDKVKTNICPALMNTNESSRVLNGFNGVWTHCNTWWVINISVFVLSVYE